MKNVCTTYAEAGTKNAHSGARVISVDEKTGIQAIQRNQETLPSKPGLEERMEADYTRHGTLCLIANFDVVTGKIVAPHVGATRTEEDFVNDIERVVDTDPEASWTFVADQLNTHKSEALVCLVAKLCGIKCELGKKGRRGILESMESRRAFLEDPSHRIRFVFTPRHASWLNQVEIWFSVLCRRVLRRGSFSSTDDLRDKILAFIEYFNRALARPYKWTYKGRPLQGG